MAGRLAGKVALVTGSTRGIGRTTAELFAAEGARVAVAGRTAARGRKVVDGIRAAGGEAEFFPLDVTDEGSVSDAIAAVAAHYGGLSTLVNNAAPTDAIATTMKPMVEYTNEEWDQIISGTLSANVFWTSKHAWPFLAAAPGAAIVNVSSNQSQVGITGFSAYAAAKGGVNSVTRVMAVEGAPHDIRCNCIVVGRVVVGNDTSMFVDRGARLTRIGHPADIASLACWLASDDAAFVTGQLVTADGGVMANGDALV